MHGVTVLVMCLGDLVAAAAMWWTVRAASVGRLKLNSFSGIRTAATMASPAAWLAGHRAALPGTRRLAAGCVGAAAVSLLLLIPGWVEAAFAVATLGLVVVLVGSVPIVRAANTAARAVSANDPG